VSCPTSCCLQLQQWDSLDWLYPRKKEETALSREEDRDVEAAEGEVRPEKEKEEEIAVEASTEVARDVAVLCLE